MKRKTCTARFWTWTPGTGIVRLSIQPGQIIRHHRYTADDEGGSFTADTWEHEGDNIKHEHFHRSRDCDGVISGGYTEHAALGQLRTAPMYERRELQPAWQDARQWQRDHAAELANY